MSKVDFGQGMKMARTHARMKQAELAAAIGVSATYVSLLENLGGTITTASRHAQKNEAKIMLEACLGQLPPDYAKVILLHELEGQSASEVAKSIGRSIGAVYMLRARALTRLRELLPSESKILGESS